MKRTRIVSTPALGIVRQRTGDDAPEGAASDLVNMRLKDGALRPVGDAEVMTRIPVSSSGIIQFATYLPDGKFLYRNNTGVYCYSVNDGEALLLYGVNESFVSWKVFGKSLLLTTSTAYYLFIYKNGKHTKILVNYDEAPTASCNQYAGLSEPFTNIVFSDTWLLNLQNNEALIYISKDTTGNIYLGRWYSVSERMKSLGMVHGCYYVRLCLKLTDGTTISQSTPIYIQHGASYPTPLHVDSTTIYAPYVTNEINDIAKISGGPFFSKPTLKVTLTPSLIDFANALLENNLLHSIAIYATCKTDLYNYESCYRSNADASKREYFFSSNKTYYWRPTLNKISIDNPYFLLHEHIITNPINKELPDLYINIDVSEFDDLATKEPFRANALRHSITASNYTEYNSRIHAVDIKTKLSSGDAIVNNINNYYYHPDNNLAVSTSMSELNGWMPYGSSGVSQVYLSTNIIIEDNLYVAIKQLNPNDVFFFNTSGDKTIYSIILPNVIAYPDARASSVRLFVVKNGVHYLILEKPLTPCLSGNFSYVIGECLSFEDIIPKRYGFSQPLFYIPIPSINSSLVFSAFTQYPNPPAESREFAQTNRLQVYNYGSPLTYELKNSYRFGASTERLLRCEAAVDQLSEGRFGQFPLYCFTDCALYALEQGNGEVLYATSHPISADGLISYEGVTPIRGGVAFVTSKGVMFVSGRQVIELSGPIRGAAEYYDAATGLPDVFRFMDVSAALGGPQEPALKTYLAGAELHQLYNEGELIAYNRQYAYAWVYGMESKMWYRRQLPYTNIQRVGTSLISYAIMPARGSQVPALYRSNIEREQSYSNKPMLYISRPLEFGSNGYKKLEGAMARISNTSGGLVHICILGSIDGVRYGKIQGATVVAKENTISDIMLGRSGISVRSVVVAILFDANMRTTVERFDFDLEDRFTSRLR